jgi:hypothetical protein
LRVFLKRRVDARSFHPGNCSTLCWRTSRKAPASLARQPGPFWKPKLPVVASSSKTKTCCARKRACSMDSSYRPGNERHKR